MPDVKQTRVAHQWAHGRPLIACRFDPSGRFAFATSEDGAIVRFSMADGAKTAFQTRASWPFALACSLKGDVIVSGGGDGQLVWWQTEGDGTAPLRTVDAHQGWIRSLAVSPDGTLLLSGGNDHRVKLWNLAEGTLVREFSGAESQIHSVVFHPNGQFVLGGELKGPVRQWEISTGQLVRTFDASKLYSYNAGQGVDFGGVRALAISADGQQLACGGLFNASNPLGAVHDPLILRIEWDSQKVLQEHVAADLKGVIWRCQFLADGTIVGCSGGSSGGFLSFWGAGEAKELHRFALPNIVRDLDLHSDGERILTAHHDGHVRVSQMAAAA